MVASMRPLLNWRAVALISVAAIGAFVGFRHSKVEYDFPGRFSRVLAALSVFAERCGAVRIADVLREHSRTAQWRYVDNAIALGRVGAVTYTTTDSMDFDQFALKLGAFGKANQVGFLLIRPVPTPNFPTGYQALFAREDRAKVLEYVSSLERTKEGSPFE